MNRIEDEQIKFYLEHKVRIREWAALGAEVSRFVDRFYRSLEGDLDAALGNGRIADRRVEVFMADGDWPGLGLRRQDWPEGDEEPDVRLEWYRKSADFPRMDTWFAESGRLWPTISRPSPKRRVPITHVAPRGGPPPRAWNLQLAGSGRVTT